MSEWIILPVFLAFASSVWAYWKARQFKRQLKLMTSDLNKATRQLRQILDHGDTE